MLEWIAESNQGLNPAVERAAKNNNRNTGQLSGQVVEVLNYRYTLPFLFFQVGSFNEKHLFSFFESEDTRIFFTGNILDNLLNLSQIQGVLWHCLWVLVEGISQLAVVVQNEPSSQPPLSLTSGILVGRDKKVAAASYFSL